MKKLLSVFASVISITSVITTTGFSVNAPKTNFKLQVGDSNFFNTAYHSAKIGFPNLLQQYNHEKKYQENSLAWNGPTYDAYWGRDYTYPFNAQQIIKDSPLSDFTLAFLNNLYTEDETHNLGAGYVDSIQEIHALGGNVTISFGGWTPSETSFWNNDPSAAVMYKHLLDTSRAFNVTSFDFDIELNHIFDGNDAIALSQALAKLRTTLTEEGKVLKIRFTVGTVDTNYLKPITKYLGSDFVWNDMSWTSYTVSQSQANDPKYVIRALNFDKSLLKQFAPFKNMTDYQVYHHLGITNAIDRNEISYDSFKEFTPWAIKNGLGLIAIWIIGNDHKVDSPLNPTENNGNQKTDFQYTNLLQTTFGNISSWNKPFTIKPQQVSGLRVYSKSKDYISLKWNNVKNAQYYRLEDNKGNIISQVQRCFGTISFREYPNLKVNGNHTFKVVAVNNAGISIVSKSLTVKIDTNLIDSQIEYYDANIAYPNITYASQATPNPWTKYVFYEGKIYQDINTSKNGIDVNAGAPNINKKDWKLIGQATDQRFGLTVDRIKDLNNFVWKQNINDTAPITYVQFNKGDNTLIKMPNINDFEYPIIIKNKEWN